ncbi:MAG TPA: hypothetical protein VGL56_03205 [Fimbriimonadaceae bacterium]
MSDSLDLHPCLQLARKSSVVITVLVPENGSQRMGLASGFVVQVRDDWFLVTAAHALVDIEHAIERAAPETVGLRLHCLIGDIEGTVFSVANLTTISVPALGKQLLAQATTDSEREVASCLVNDDVVLIALSDYYRRHLFSSGLCPLVGKDVSSDIFPKSTADAPMGIQFFMCGAPLNSLTSMGVAFKFMEVWPKSYEAPIYEFAPQWSDELHRGSVKGMSGGGVFAFFGNGDVRLIGVQSAQDRTGSHVDLLKVADTTNIFRMLLVPH